MKQFLKKLMKKNPPKASNLTIETENGRYFHEHKVKAILNTLLNSTIEDASDVILKIASAEKIKLNG